MARVLYIKASPMGELSFSTAVTEAFIEAYKQAQPKDEVDVLDLFDEELPDFDFAAASAKYKIMHGKEHSHEEEKVWQGVLDVIERFKTADKYVLAVPMWNFGVPYRFKQYVDVIVQPGQTFTVTDEGYKGLTGDKPVFVAYARGGDYSEGTGRESLDFQKPYVETILGFVGLTDVRSVTVEPTLQGGPDTAEQKRSEAIDQARKMAQSF